MSLLRCAIAGLLVAAAAGAAAQSYPARPVRVIVPVGPGGGLDFIARLVAPKLGDALNQSVVVDNRTGASGNIGVELAAQAAIMRQPATVARLDETGIDAIGSTPQEFAAYLKADLQRWTDVIRRTGIRID